MRERVKKQVGRAASAGGVWETEAELELLKQLELSSETEQKLSMEDVLSQLHTSKSLPARGRKSATR